MAAADALLDAYQGVLKDPTNSEVNLQYALVAEGNKKYRLALAAYERVLANDPGNKAALAGLQRMRRIIEPASTLVTSEVGATFETNPLEVETGSQKELFPYAKLHIKDERNIFGTRWRSTADIWGEYHPEIDELSSVSTFADTGPIIDIPGTLTDVHPAVGAGAGYFDGRFAYTEVSLSSTLEGYLDGAYEWARVRGAYRDYSPSFTSSGGVYVGADGRLSRDRIFNQSDIVSVAPWILWSDIPGSVPDINSNLITPGRYFSGGAKFEYDQAVSQSFTVGMFVGVSGRVFATDPADSGGRREDFLLSPGVSLLFTNIFGRAQTDFRIDYEYDRNRSNAAGDSYENQTVTFALVSRR